MPETTAATTSTTPTPAGAAAAYPPAVSGIRPPQSFCIDGNVADSWRLFKQKWQNYSVITNLNRQEMSYQVALLLHTLEDEALKIYNGFSFANTESERTVNEILEKFDNFAVGEVNETYERFMYYKRDQKESESFESFFACVRILIKSCNFCENCINSILRDRIILGIRNPETQSELLKEPKLTLDGAIRICKAAESATDQSQAIRPAGIVPNKVNAVSKSKKKVFSKPYKSVQNNDKECHFCGRCHSMTKELFITWGKTCAICKKKNHFALKCPTKNERKPKSVNLVTEGDDIDWINTVNYSNKEQLLCSIIVGSNTVQFQVDTGATGNVIPEKYIKQRIYAATNKLKMWNGVELSPIGSTTITVKNPKNDKCYDLEFIVVSDQFIPLMSLKSAILMSIIDINYVAVSQSTVNKFGEVFDGKLGKLPGCHHLQLDENVKPVVMPTGRLPISLKPKLKEELNRLQNLGVITPVDEPTPWVSQCVVTKKKTGDLRICIDPQQLNLPLQREHFTLPILEDTLHELGESRVISKADLSFGYWHIMLDDVSSKLTTFQSCFGRYRWKRLPFGLAVSSEIFQKILLEAIYGLPGVVCVADDLIIHGKDEDDHDRNLEGFLNRCQEKGIKLGKEKLIHRLNKVNFMGNLITAEGLKPDSDKVRAVIEMQEPKNLEELRRYLGFINYLSRYIPNLTDMIHPLRNLTKKDVPWSWSSTQQSAFNLVNSKITNAPVLAYYDPEKELVLENDAGEYGMGAAIFQGGKPIAYASRSLSSAGKNYAQIEKEMLPVNFGLEKFHHYTYGRHLTVITDHKPLVAIKKKALSTASRRIQSLLLRSQVYNSDLIYQPGNSIPVADSLSRAPLKATPTVEIATLHNLTFTPIKQERLDKIQSATEADTDLTALRNVIMTGWPRQKSQTPVQVMPYFHYRDELTVQNGIILRGDRVIIPKSMRKDIKERLHVGHLGINSYLRRARELVYWPGVSAEIRQYIDKCDICLSMSDKQSHEPLVQHSVPFRPWEKVGTDIFTLETI